MICFNFPGWYDLPTDVVFSLPVTFTTKGDWVIVPDLELSDEVKTKLQDIAKVSLSTSLIVSVELQSWKFYIIWICSFGRWTIKFKFLLLWYIFTGPQVTVSS